MGFVQQENPEKTENDNINTVDGRSSSVLSVTRQNKAFINLEKIDSKS